MGKRFCRLVTLLPLLFLFNCSDQADRGEEITSGDASAHDLASIPPSIPDADIQSTVSSGEVVGIAKMFLKLVSAGNFNNAAVLLSPPLKEKMPAAQLKKWWETEIQERGPFRNRGVVGIASENGRSVIYIGCIFEKGIRDLRVEFNSGSQIEDLSLVPTGVFQGLPMEVKQLVETEEDLQDGQ